MMNIIDYLIGNTDRHLRNWGFWINNDDNIPGRLFSLMDFNRSFRSSDCIEGINQGKRLQMEAAINGVQEIGLNQIQALPEDLSDLFSELNSLRETHLDLMFQKRLDILLKS